MYPVSLGYGVAKQRINALLANGHDAEALVTTAFTIEKTLRRTLRQIIVSAGFWSTVADKIVSNHGGLKRLKEAWELYDPAHRPLTSIIAAADWNIFQTTATMRNKMVHGERVYALADCQRQANDALAALDRAKAALDAEYGYSGWASHSPRRTSHLHQDPKITWSR